MTQPSLLIQLCVTISLFFSSILSAEEAPAFVEIRSLDSSIRVEMPYASPRNFTGRRIYPAKSKAYLRAPVAQALVAAHQELQKQGLGIKVWDAYRPFSVQEKFWKLVPNEKYVAKPVRDGANMVQGSSHNKGAAVDITLVNTHGKEMKMPTAYDDFTEKAHRSYMAAGKEAIHHRNLLEEVMQRHGFVGLPTEWWHFSWKDGEGFPLSDEPISSVQNKTRKNGNK